MKYLEETSHMGEQGWGSGESTRFPSMGPGFNRALIVFASFDFGSLMSDVFLLTC